MTKWEYCVVIYESFWLSSKGVQIKDFEKDLEEYKHDGWVIHRHESGARLQKCRLRTSENGPIETQTLEHGDYFHIMTQLGLNGWEMIGNTLDVKTYGGSETLRLFFKHPLP